MSNRYFLFKWLWSIVLFAALVGCGTDMDLTPTAVPSPTIAPSSTPTAIPSPTAVPAPVEETAVVEIPLSGDLTDRDAEISGMDWYGDYLILMPQYPTFAHGRGSEFVYALPRADIEAFLSGKSAAPLNPIPIPFEAPFWSRKFAGFEGYEAIAFDGDTVYLTIEASGGSMKGYLVKGSIAPDLSRMTLDEESLTTIPMQADIDNTTDETLLLVGGAPLTIYEANGAMVNPSPVAHLFDAELNEAGTLPFPRIEYRITDATNLDENGRFWAVNYNFPETAVLQTDNDPIAAAHGKGASHAKTDGVERLVEFQYHPQGITMIETAPIQLELLPDDLRNWEGIVRLTNQGFLLATDKYPTTILAFVPKEQ